MNSAPCNHEPLTPEQLDELVDRLHNPTRYTDQPVSPYWHEGYGLRYVLQRAAVLAAASEIVRHIDTINMILQSTRSDT